jgi:7,8-dihydro-6-hydroxymethylpterin-pyrophosphokinase
MQEAVSCLGLFRSNYRRRFFRRLKESSSVNRKSRNAYFNEAINLNNKLHQRKLLKKALAQESQLVGDDSLEVLRAFERLEDQLGE